MPRRLALLVLPFLAAAAEPADDLSALGDEFAGSELSPAWKRFDRTHGWPDKLKAVDVGRSVDGALHLEPYHSAWVRDLVAPFLYKEVTGDFDVRARVRVRGREGAVPGGTWSLGGLMARTPNANRADAWTPHRENWQFLTTGVGHVAGETMTETKATYNSSSHLKLRPFPSGWVELRLVRVGMSLFALARPEGGAWRVRDRFYRMDGGRETQVGLIAYTTSPDVPRRPEDPALFNRERLTDPRVDMLMDVDWVRFARPRPKAAVDWYGQASAASPLADPNLPEAELLRALGD
ncbi:MAG TPA: hypothetical protein VF636_03820 [Sphingomonas sp.]|jgi:hypothetical protein